MKWMKTKTWFAKVPSRPVKACLITAAAVSVLSLFIPNSYSSDAAILPGNPKLMSGTGAIVNLVSAISGSTPSDPSTSYTDILNSRWITDKLLADSYEYSDHWFMFMPRKARKGTLEEYLNASNHDKAVQAFPELFKVSHDIKSGLVTIEATTRSPELSAAIVKNALKHLDEFMNDDSRTHSGATAAFLQERLDRAKKAEAKSEDDLLQFAMKNRGYRQSNDPTVSLRGTSLETELDLRRELVRTISTNLEQALMQAKDDTPVVNVLDEGSLPIEKHSPHRGLLVVVFGMLAALLQWSRDNWSWVQSKFKAV